MTILFLTLGFSTDPRTSTIYNDLAGVFLKKGHTVYVACQGEKTQLEIFDGCRVLRVRVGPITKCGLIRKGVASLLLPYLFIRAIQKQLSGIKFDLVLCSTPPVTFGRIVRFIKRRDHAASYLLLKDIFPQNAVDLGLLRRNGPRVLLWQYFRRQERMLYEAADHIGCMSQANVDFLLSHNPGIDPARVEICPNSLHSGEIARSDGIRRRYGIPEEAVVFLLGGSLGLPQGLGFFTEVLRRQKDKPGRFFVVCGAGTGYAGLGEFLKREKLADILLLPWLPGGEYDSLAAACDVGIVTLDSRFTVPNFPSRILGYMRCGLPVLAATDRASDLSEAIREGNFGWWCPSDDVGRMSALIDAICEDPPEIRRRGANARLYLEYNYTPELSFKIIIRHFD